MTAFSTKRRSLLTLIGSLAIFRNAGSGAEDTFTLVPNIFPGQVLRYRQDLELVRNGEIGYRSRSTVMLEICERIAGGWLARWTSSGGELLEADHHVRPMLEAMQTFWAGVAVDLLLDEGGRVADLADPAAVRALGVASMDRLMALLLANPANAPLADVLRAAMQPALGDSAVLARSLLKEPAILLGAMGHDYRVGEPLDIRTHIPSPIGSGEIPILGRYQVRGISTRDQRADIGWLMVIDNATAARHIGKEILDMVQRLQAATPEPADTPPEPTVPSTVADFAATLDYDDRCDFVVDTETAWPVSVRHIRRVSAAGRSRIDTVKLTRMDA